jgi:hypothetical protein
VIAHVGCVKREGMNDGRNGAGPSVRLIYTRAPQVSLGNAFRTLNINHHYSFNDWKYVSRCYLPTVMSSVIYGPLR